MSLHLKLYPVQRECFKAALQHRGFLLWADTGTGKTIMSLAIAEKRWERGQINRVMVIAPLHLKAQWVSEILRWLPHAIVVDDPHRMPQDGELLFFVTHYEYARTTQQLKVLRKKPLDMIIVDECHKLKSRSSKQSRRLWLIGKTAMYRLAMTGSPIEGDELDFWAQMRFIDDTIFGDSYTEFKEQWTVGSGFMGKKRKLVRHRKDEFLERVRMRSFRLDKRENWVLPPIANSHVPCAMTGKQLTTYRRMEQTMMAEVDGHVIAAPLAITQLMRLQQLAGGYITDEDGEDHGVGSSKLVVLQDIIEGCVRPIVVFARFKWEIDQIGKLVTKLGRKLSMITGKLKIGSHTDFDVLVCNVAMMAGLDGLQHVSDIAVFYSKTFSKIQLEQACGRLDRDGQKSKSITFIHLEAKNTVDDDLRMALEAKGDTTNAVLQFFKQRTHIMAKSTTKTTTKAAEPAVETETKTTAKAAGYGIGYLVDETDIEQPKVRVMLRSLKIEKDGGRYNWAKKSDADAVVKQLKAANAAKPPAGKTPKAEAAAATSPAPKVTKKAA